jgi:hypothetical protein
MNVPPEQQQESRPENAAPSEPVAAEPFIYQVASRLHRVMHLTRDQQLSLWRRVLDLYAQTDKPVPPSMRSLCHEPFVEGLLHNEVFWGLAGAAVSRDYYSRATDCLPAVFAEAALLAAQKDKLPLSPDELALLPENSA